MKSQLTAIITKLQALHNRAAGLADSENETTAEKYADIPDAIQEALDTLNSILSDLE